LQAWPEAQPAQLAPDVPHEDIDWEAYGSHVPVTPPTQQPFGHVFALQEHVPIVLSQRPLVQFVQLAPPLPQRAGDSEAYATHVPLLQQPPGHELASHVQADALLEHSSPVAHDPHTAPAAPQEVLVCEA
jgi:hypothetical protein